MTKQVSLYSLLLLLLITGTSSCKKESTTDTSFNCESTITGFKSLPPFSDSTLLRQTLKGEWIFTCYKFTSKYNYVSHYTDTSSNLKLEFTDTTYSYYQNDSLLFTYPLFITPDISIQSHSSFYYGVLGGGGIAYKDSMLGIPTVYPYTGFYYLLFKRK